MRPIQTLKTRFDAARAAHDAGDLRGARAALLALANDRAVADDDSLPAGALDHALAAVQARLGHAGLAADYARAANRQRRRALLAGGAAFPDMRAALGPAALAPAAVAAWRRLPMALDEPVFLLGLADPGRRRLIDHLAAHPGVRLITEPALIGQVVTAAPGLGADAAALAHLEPTEAAALRADYLRRRADLAGGGDAAGAG